MSRISAAFFAILLTTGTARAQWNELANGGGDAGDLPASAQAIIGNGSLNSISGVHTLNDADMFLIDINNAAAFSAIVDASTNFDTQLFLFDESEMGIAHHDDVSQTNRRSRLTNQFVAPAGAGLYYLAISAWDRDPSNGDGVMWNDAPSSIERSPDGPGGGVGISDWDDPLGADPGGAYTIQLTGCRFIVSGECEGDFNQDGRVDLSDLATLLANFGSQGVPPSGGDIDGDADVDLADLARLLALFGTTC